MNQLAQMIGRSDANGTMATKVLLALFLVFAAFAIVPAIGLG